MESQEGNEKRQLNILLVIDSLKIGGAENQFATLAVGLNRKRFDIHVGVLGLSENGYENSIKESGFDITVFRRKFKLDFSPIYDIYRFIKDNNIHIVHSFLSLGAIFGVIAARFAGVPVVCSGIRDSKDQSAIQFLYKRFEASFADILISNSYAGFNNRFKTQKSNFRVVYNGLDTSRFVSEKSEIEKVKNELGLNDFEHIVGMVASLSPFKDHDTFLKAASIVKKKTDKVCFLLIGDGQNRRAITETIDKLDLKKNVVVTGYRMDMGNVYALFDVSVLMTNASKILEGISNTILESMAMNIPVIASRGGGTDEIIQDNTNGLLVEPGNAQQLADSIIELLTNKERAAFLSANALHDISERFSNDKYVENTTRIYNELLYS